VRQGHTPWSSHTRLGLRVRAIRGSVKAASVEGSLFPQSFRRANQAKQRSPESRPQNADKLGSPFVPPPWPRRSSLCRSERRQSRVPAVFHSTTRSCSTSVNLVTNLIRYRSVSIRTAFTQFLVSKDHLQLHLKGVASILSSFIPRKPGPEQPRLKLIHSTSAWLDGSRVYLKVYAVQHLMRSVRMFDLDGPCLTPNSHYGRNLGS